MGFVSGRMFARLLPPPFPPITITPPPAPTDPFLCLVFRYLRVAGVTPPPHKVKAATPTLTSGWTPPSVDFSPNSHNCAFAEGDLVVTRPEKLGLDLIGKVSACACIEGGRVGGGLGV